MEEQEFSVSPVPFDSSDDDFNVEIVDLDADTATHAEWRALPLATRFVNWQASLTKKQIRKRGVTGMVLLIFFALLLMMQHTLLAFASSIVPSPPRFAEKLPVPLVVKPSLVIWPQRDGFACVDNDVWSPDNTQIAVVGYEQGCDQSKPIYEPTQIALYDAHSGLLLKKIQLGDVILRAFHRQFPASTGKLYIFHGDLLWSPRDPHQMALFFSLLLSTQASYPNSTLTEGVVLVNTVGHAPYVLLSRPPLATANSYPIYTEWDIQYGDVVNRTIYNYQNDAITPFVPALPAADSYSWGADGRLLPERLYGHETPSAPLIGPPGNADGGASFSMWRSGSVGLLAHSSYGLPYNQGAYLFISASAAWSPDGRYLIDTFETGGRLLVAGQRRLDKNMLATLHVDQLPLLPVHDAALQAVLKQLSPDVSTYMDQAAVSWSPNGRLLAVSHIIGQDEQPTSIYQCDTGYKIATLVWPDPYPSPGLSQSYVFSNPLNWSSDGSRFLSQNLAATAVIVWQLHMPR